jgi:peptidoglycan/LPS O-acetylase OafA/YrhL
MLYHQQILEAGWVGVQIFFVLSGFLISRSLYRARSLRIAEYLTTFYGRRALRIFPLYFAMLLALAGALAVGIQLTGVRAGLPFAATYTYNFWQASPSFEHSKFIAHFWSLSVEEQFYLVWPFVMFFCPERRLRPLLLAIIAAGPVIRLATFGVLSLPDVHSLADKHVALYVLTPSHIDAFAVGAYVSLYPLGGMPKLLYTMLATCVVSGLAVVALSAADAGVGAAASGATWGSLGYPLGLSSGYAFIWGYSLLNISTALLIDCLVHKKCAPWLFDNGALRYIGKISYGLYLLHYPVQSIVGKALPGPVWRQLIVQSLLTTVIAAAAYRFLELPFLALKDRWFVLSAPSSLRGAENPRVEAEVRLGSAP